MPGHRLLLLTFLCLLAEPGVAQVHAPLQVSNQHPLIRIFGLPVAENSRVLDPGQETSHISVDWASNFTNEANSTEQIYLDGESAQVNIRWRYGFNLWEVGLDINFSRYSGGSLDSFIESWHDWFSLPNGNREFADSNQLRYDYVGDGLTQLSVSDSHSGFGDTRLTGAFQIPGTGRFDLAVRGGVKIPTGDSSKLLGSDGTDVNLGLILGDNISLQNYQASYFVGGGVLWTEDGNILPAMRENTVYYFHSGFSKNLLQRWQLKVQIDGHSEFYESGLDPLGGALQLSFGGSYRLSNDLKLDFAVVEDIITDSSSDVSFHINLYNFF